MNKTAISIYNIGKEYKIGEKVEYESLRDDITNFVRKGLNRLVFPQSNRTGNEDNVRSDYFWSLKDISFEVQRGEIIGIIGRNGAGKSTLLKIIAGIIQPTEGRIDIYGRIGSLLEVGTGFHMELSGRENIYLNGAILGMRRSEIDRKFDEIVDFSGVEKFIDTPVKYYSTGMRVRLGFSVAAHLEPEILLIDEVLAVGDAAFQKKCLGKLNNISMSDGRTVLFVSHNMASILSLCDKTVLIDHGKIIKQGLSSEVVETYFQSFAETKSIPLDERVDRGGDGSVIVTSITVENADDGKPIRPSSKLKFTVSYRSQSKVNNLRAEIFIKDFKTGAPILLLDSDTTSDFPQSIPPQGNLVCVTDNLFLTPGTCTVNVLLRTNMNIADELESAAQFYVETENFYPSGKTPTRDYSFYIVKNYWYVDS